jgi:hypothetical protein
VDSNTKDVLLVALSLVGSIAGVCIGFLLQESSTRRRQWEATFDTVEAISLEVGAYLYAIELFFDGKAPEPDPPRADIGPEFFRLTPRLGRASQPIQVAMNELRDAVMVATGSIGVTAPERQAQRDGIMTAIAGLETAARWELRAHWWQRAWRAIERRLRGDRP